MKNILSRERKSQLNLTPFRITAIYVTIGSLWIWFSDEILLALVRHAGTLSKLQTFKGWFYVTVTGLILYWLIYRGMKATQQSERALRQANEVLIATEEALRQNLKELEISQEALQWSEERYRQIGELTSDYAYTVTVTPDGKFIVEWLAEAFYRITGYTLAELKGLKGYVRVVHPDDLPIFAANSRKLLSGEPTTSEFRIVTKHREVRWVRDYARPEWDEQKSRVVRILGAAQDITQYKQIEESLRLSERRYQTLAEAAPVGIYRTDASGRCIYVNERWSQITGLALEEALGEGWSRTLHPDDRERVLARRAEARAKNLPFQAEYRFVRPDGVLTWVFGVAFPEKGSGEEALGYIGTLTDITERKQIEESLRETERRYQTLAKIAPVGIFRTDASGRCLYVNERWCEFTGLTAEEALGQGWEQALHPDDRERVFAQWEQAVIEKVPFQSEYRFQRRDGVTTWVFGQGLAEINSRKETIGYVGTITDINQIKQTEQALRESEAKFRAISEASPIPIMIPRFSDGVLLYANQEVSKYFGVSADQLIGRKAIDLYDDPTDRQKVLDKLNKDGYFHNYEVKAKKPDGTTFWILVSSQLLMFNGEKAILGVFYDITERKEMEEALRESERRYRLLFESNPHPMWVYDKETLGFMAVNDAAIQHYGYSQDEFLSMTIKNIRPPEEVPALIKNISQEARGLRKAGIWRHSKKDGTPIDVEIIAHEVTFAGRRTELVLANDVTERQQAEMALRESEEKYRELVNNLKEIIFQQDVEGVWTFLNPAWFEVMGYTVEETLGTCFLDYVHSDDRHDCHAQFYRLLYIQADDCRYEARYLAKDGSIRWLAMFARRLGKPGGEAFGTTGTLMDITERKAAETRLQSLNTELERQVEERTAQLQTQMQELRQLNYVKDDFLSTVSHELRTPMTNMKMAIRMLQLAIGPASGQRPEGEEANPQRFQKAPRYVQILENECDREIELINDLLDLQRLETVHSPPVWETICLQEWLPQAVLPFQSRLRNRQQTLRIHIESDVLPLHSNLASWERIVAELLNNACKYTPPGGEITVRLQQAFASTAGEGGSSLVGNFTQLLVSNSGSQIPADQLTRIFDKFYRVPSSDPWKQGGTGLGLALVKQLVQQLGGRIWADSEPERTQFTVELPTDTEC